MQVKSSLKSDKNVISPVIEEISGACQDDKDDTDSEISELPTDEEEKIDDGDDEDNSSDTETSNCDTGTVPTQQTNTTTKPSSKFNQEESEIAEEEVREDDYSSFEENSQSLSSSESSTGSGSYSSQQSYRSSLSNSVANTTPSSDNQVNLVDVDRFKKQNSPDTSLHESRTNEETKTTCESYKEVMPDRRDIGEEIKVEFERQHKYIRGSRDCVKKSPEDSGFESFQQSSVEQNSNQDSDEDDVIATFSTVMEVENETSTINDDNKNVENHVGSYTTEKLFTEAEEARVRSKRLREESLRQLGSQFRSISPAVKKCDITKKKPDENFRMVSTNSRHILDQKVRPSSSFINNNNKVIF